MSSYNAFAGNMVMSDFPIFSVLGIEIEYMLVDKESLNVQPKSDLI
ncbi:glutamate--cysteine ligase, partial [Legionella pneumophila]